MFWGGGRQSRRHKEKVQNFLQLHATQAQAPGPWSCETVMLLVLIKHAAVERAIAECAVVMPLT